MGFNRRSEAGCQEFWSGQIDGPAAGTTIIRGKKITVRCPGSPQTATAAKLSAWAAGTLSHFLSPAATELHQRRPELVTLGKRGNQPLARDVKNGVTIGMTQDTGEEPAVRSQVRIFHEGTAAGRLFAPLPGKKCHGTEPVIQLPESGITVVLSQQLGVLGWLGRHDQVAGAPPAETYQGAAAHPSEAKTVSQTE